MHEHPYRKLFAMAALHFAAMYALMYAMVDSLPNVVHNLNQVYMAALMTAPMIAIELALMKPMYPNRKATLFAGGLAVLGLIGAFALIRGQVAISDRQFLRSMIPHHGGAILMCEEAAIRDTQILDLCGRIIAGQRAEIDEMKTRLDQLSE